MKKQRHITAFYMETLLLIVVFIAIILVLTQIFGLAKVQSGRARELTNAVCLAENAAEAFAASGDAEGLLALLNENGNAALTAEADGVSARYDADMRPDPGGSFRVDVHMTADGGLVSGTVQVFCGEGAPVYTLRTALFEKEASA